MVMRTAAVAISVFLGALTLRPCVATASCEAACAQAIRIAIGVVDEELAVECEYSCGAFRWSPALTSCVRAAKVPADLARCETLRLEEQKKTLGRHGTHAMADGLVRGGVELPRIQGSVELPGGVLIGVSTKEVTVDGGRAVNVACKWQGRTCQGDEHRKPAAGLFIDPVHKEHGKRTSLLIVPLHTRLEAVVDRGRAAQGAVFAMDKRIPYRTVAELIYTAAMAELHELYLAVQAPGKLRALRARAPRRGTGAFRSEEKRRPPINLTVMIRADGFALSWEASASLRPSDQTIPLRQAEAAACAAEGAHWSGHRSASGGCLTHDYAVLNRRITTLKGTIKGLQAENRINVTAADGTPWGVVARVIDAVQCLAATPNAPRTPVCAPLFPYVVFAMAD